MYYYGIDYDDSYLTHFGVKGMKWGVRKSKQPTESYRTSTKRGESMSLERQKLGLLGNTARKLSSHVREEQDKSYGYDIKNASGKKVGNIYMYQEAPGVINYNWGNVKPKYQNKGYMTAAMKESEKIARKLGAKKLTAEIVMNSPDMLHIANKMGYKQLGKIENNPNAWGGMGTDNIWGGLMRVEKRLR